MTTDKTNALLEKAEKERQKAHRALNDTRLPENARQLKHAQGMLEWATMMAGADPKSAIRWSHEASEWSKRVRVSLDAKYQDELADIRALIDSFNADSDRLKKLSALD